MRSAKQGIRKLPLAVYDPAGSTALLMTTILYPALTVGYSIVVLGEGFEPPKAEPSDLQSDVFDRFTTPALCFSGAGNRT